MLGDNGTISHTPQTLKYFPQKVNRKDGNEMTGVTRSDPKAHMQNFFDCIRGGEAAQLPVRNRLPHLHRLPHGGGKLPPATHRALGPGQGRDRLSTIEAHVDFEYTPEQIQLRKAVREFAEAEIAPHVMEWDEAQTFPLEVVRKLGKLGYMGAIFPEELGGGGTGLHRILHHHRRALARGWLGGHHRGRPHLALLQSHLQDGQRRAARALPSQAGVRRVDRAAGR